MQTYPMAGLVGQQRGTEGGLGEQQGPGGSCSRILLHLLLQVADEDRALLGWLPVGVLDGEVHEGQLCLAVLRLLIDGCFRLAL